MTLRPGPIGFVGMFMALVGATAALNAQTTTLKSLLAEMTNPTRSLGVKVFMGLDRIVFKKLIPC